MSSDRLDGKVGYGLPFGSRFVGTPWVGFATSAHGRDYRLGYSIGALGDEGMTFRPGRAESAADHRQDARLAQGHAADGGGGEARGAQQTRTARPGRAFVAKQAVVTVLPTGIGVGTPRSLQGRAAAVFSALFSAGG